MQSKITQIEPRGQYTNASGTFNKYQVYLANGNNYQFLAKGDFKKEVGQIIDYEITNEQYNTAKLIYKPIQAAPTANREQIIVRQSMVKAAADFHASRPNADIQTVIADAQLLINFVNNE